MAVAEGADLALRIQPSWRGKKRVGAANAGWRVAATVRLPDAVTHARRSVTMTACQPRLDRFDHRNKTMLSARNQLPATVKSVKLGNIMAEVLMTVGDVELVAAITRGSAEALGLKAGDTVMAIIKSTEVMIDKS
jgi:molybdopterin-binding protein